MRWKRGGRLEEDRGSVAGDASVMKQRHLEGTCVEVVKDGGCGQTVGHLSCGFRAGAIMVVSRVRGEAVGGGACVGARVHIFMWRPETFSFYN